MKIFEKIARRYALRNYYLRRNFYWPDTLPEIFDYQQQHNELPFLYDGETGRMMRCASGSAARASMFRNT